MANTNPDNLTDCIEKAITKLARARGKPAAPEIMRQTVIDLQERINAERVEAAGRLGAWLAHQINNPLGAISGSAQLLARRLERDVDDDNSLSAYRRYTDGIQSHTERCARITADLLDFTRPREVVLRSTDIRRVVDEAVELARFGREEAVIEVEPVGEVGPKVRTDKDLLTRALYEVIVNAVESSPKGGAVKVELVTESSEVRVTVSDSGPGISDEAMPRVFDPFFSTRDKSRGLGLTTSLAIVRQLGGSLEVNETGPGGTVMTVRIHRGGRRK